MKTNTLYSVLVLLLIYFAASFGAHAVSPAPDVCSPNFTTAEGCNALNLLSTGSGNSGVGWYALFSNSTGNFNTGVGGSCCQRRLLHHGKPKNMWASHLDARARDEVLRVCASFRAHPVSPV